MQKFNILIRTLIVCSLCILLGINVMQAKGEKFTIVIDAGHGGKDSGAIGSGAKEKDINLAVATKLGDLIKKKLKNVKVVYTRDGDYFVSLEKRAEISNNAKADLFISIHSNDAAKGSSASGSEVYVVGYHKDDDSRRVAHRENLVIEIEENYKEKYSGFDPDSDESYIIFEMDQRGKIAQSLKLAELIQRNLVNDAGRADRGVKQAGFRVLWSTAAPSVLIELDFMSNASSLEYLTSKSGQETLARCIFDGVADYLDILQGKKHVSFNTVESENNSNRTSRRNREASEEKPVAKAEPAGNTQPVKRGRRDPKSREASDSRNVEIDDTVLVTVSAETSQVGVEVASQTVEPVQSSSDTDSWTSTKPKHQNDKKQVDNKQVDKKQKDKKQDEKKAEEKKKEEKKQEEKKQDTKSRREVKDSNADQNTNTAANRKHDGKVSSKQTYYTIEILASDGQLSESDVRFKGYSPVKCFEEGGLFKYTYGESSKKKEMDELLKTVKKDFPDARVIKIYKDK